MRIVYRSIIVITIVYGGFLYLHHSEKKSQEPKPYISTPERFEKAFENLIKEEGGYVNNKSDPGGETKYGISKRSYPNIDIKSLTLDDAKKIYHTDFWQKIRGDDLPSDHVACEALEQSVNMGIKTAVSFMQISGVASGCSIDVDGRMGDKTLECLNTMDGSSLLMSIKALAILFYKRLARERPPMQKFLKGWIKRVTT